MSGCNCKNMEGFDLVMFKAKSYESKTGKKAAVFIVNKKTPSFTDLSNISKVENICCYFTTDGVEHKITKKTEAIEEIIEDVVTKHKNKRKPSKKKD